MNSTQNNLTAAANGLELTAERVKNIPDRVAGETNKAKTAAAVVHILFVQIQVPFLVAVLVFPLGVSRAGLGAVNDSFPVPFVVTATCGP
jgi:hypothetical protein